MIFLNFSTRPTCLSNFIFVHFTLGAISPSMFDQCEDCLFDFCGKSVPMIEDLLQVGGQFPNLCKFLYLRLHRLLFRAIISGIGGVQFESLPGNYRWGLSLGKFSGVCSLNVVAASQHLQKAFVSAGQTPFYAPNTSGKK